MLIKIESFYGVVSFKQEADINSIILLFYIVTESIMVEHL